MARKHFSDYSYKDESKRFTSFENKQNDLPIFAKGCDPFNFMPHVRDMAKQADELIKAKDKEIERLRFLVTQGRHELFKKKLITFDEVQSWQ